jgi:hypothetical protein
MLPDGRFFGQKLQKGPQKISLAVKFGGREITEFSKKWQTRGWKYFCIY